MEIAERNYLFSGVKLEQVEIRRTPFKPVKKNHDKTKIFWNNAKRKVSNKR